MSSAGSSSEQAHALIASGLRLADRADLLGALSYWELATEFAPNLRAASLLVELTEAFLEARETGISLETPDFRGHLLEIGYVLPDESGTNSGVSGRVPGTPSSTSGLGRESSRPPAPASPRSSGGRDATWQGPVGAAEARDPGRTAYGLPLRQQDEGSDLGGRPRYRATAPPPPAHRRQSTTTRQPVPDARDAETAERPARPSSARPSVARPAPSRTSTDPRVEPAEPGRHPSGRERLPGSRSEADPWADLGSELAQVASGEWRIPGGGEMPPTGNDTRPVGPVPLSAWDEAEGTVPPEPRTTASRGVATAPGRGDPRLADDLPEHLKDPFAVLEHGGLAARPATAPSVRYPGQSEATRPARVPDPHMSFEPAMPSTPSGTSPGLFDLFEDENLAVGDPFEGQPLLDPEPGLVPEPALEVVGEPEEVDEGYEFELVEDESGEILTNPVYTPPWDDEHEELAEGRHQARELWDRARHHHSLGDYSTSEKLLEQLLETEPGNREAERLLEDNRQQREKRSLTRLRSVTATPRIVLGQEQLVWQNLDAKKGFVLSRVDGLLTVQDIIDIANLPRHETIQILADLVEEGILAMT